MISSDLRCRLHRALQALPQRLHEYSELLAINAAMPTVQRAGSGATVTGIATLCGFSDLGRFAVRYRQLYGQPPSQTLRQAAQSLHRHSTGVCRRSDVMVSRGG